ncbi:hypothetical protein WJX84_011917 [Apatococcus fuscideae]|uniref:Uncharacterized protein n=1 Tax=Apatococcus fuscideae TaxID=2026836 RepID=A0AAW1SME1_9CHLO
MYGRTEPESLTEGLASRGHKDFSRAGPKLGAKARSFLNGGRNAPLLQLAAGSLDAVPASGRLAPRQPSRPASTFPDLEDGPPFKVPRRARSALVQRRSSGWGKIANQQAQVSPDRRSRWPEPQQQSLTDDSEREQEVAEALFDLANACGPVDVPSDEAPSEPVPERDDPSGGTTSSQGSKAKYGATTCRQKGRHSRGDVAGHKGEASKRKRVEASAGLRAQTPSPHPQSPPQGAPVTVSHPPIGPGPSGYKGGPLPPLGRPVTGGLNHHPFSLGSPASTFFSKPGQTSGTGAFTDLSKSSNRNGFHLVEPRFHPPPIPMKTEPGGNGVLPPSLLNSLEPRPISMLDALRQPVGPFPKLTKNCETHVHIARLIRYFMRQGKAAPEWAPGGAGQQQGWGPHSIHSPIVMGSLPPHLMPSGAIMGGNTVPRQRGRAGPPKPSRDRQEQEREMQQAAGRPLLGTPLPGGPRDGLLPQGHRSHSPDSKVVPGEPAGMLRPGPDQMGSPIHHMMPHTHQPSGTSTAPAPQPLPHFNPMPSPYQGGLPQSGLPHRLKQPGPMYGPPLGDGGLRNSGPNPSGLLPNGMANMGKLGPPTPANMNAYTAQQQHMLHQYHLSVMHPGMNPFFNNSMMLPAGQMSQAGGGNPHGMLSGFHSETERMARDQLMMQHVQRQLPPGAYQHAPNYLQRENTGMASGINLNPMGAKRSPMEAGLAGRQEEPAAANGLSAPQISKRPVIMPADRPTNLWQTVAPGSCDQVWPTGLVWTEAEAYAAYGSRARFGPEDATFRSLSSRSLWAPDEELLLQEGSEASVWLPAFPAVDTTDVFEQLAQSRQRGSMFRTVPQYPMTAVSLAHSATQTDARISCSTGSQTAFDVSSVRSSLDVSTQTGQPLFLQCGVSEGLDSLEPFLQHEHNLAQARAHRRVLLMRLLRELRALNMTKTSGDRLAESHTASIATQTETFCSATKKGRELTPEEWTPFDDIQVTRNTAPRSEDESELQDETDHEDEEDDYVMIL